MRQKHNIQLANFDMASLRVIWLRWREELGNHRRQSQQRWMELRLYLKYGSRRTTILGCCRRATLTGEKARPRRAGNSHPLKPDGTLGFLPSYIRICASSCVS